MDGPCKINIESQFFNQFTTGRVQVCLTPLNATAGCRPENEWLVLPLYIESDQKYLLRGVEDNDAGGATIIVRHFAGHFQTVALIILWRQSRGWNGSCG